MSWPPKIGEPLPRGGDAYNVSEKLLDYSLNLEHRVGGPKAAGFLRILGISAEDLDYLAETLLSAARELPVAEVRENEAHGIKCTVIVPVRGLGQRSERIAAVRTVWRIAEESARPRLVTAFIEGKLA